MPGDGTVIGRVNPAGFVSFRTGAFMLRPINLHFFVPFVVKTLLTLGQVSQAGNSSLDLSPTKQ